MGCAKRMTLGRKEKSAFAVIATFDRTDFPKSEEETDSCQT